MTTTALMTTHGSRYRPQRVRHRRARRAPGPARRARDRRPHPGPGHRGRRRRRAHRLPARLPLRALEPQGGRRPARRASRRADLADRGRDRGAHARVAPSAARGRASARRCRPRSARASSSASGAATTASTRAPGCARSASTRARRLRRHPAPPVARRDRRLRRTGRRVTQRLALGDRARRSRAAEIWFGTFGLPAGGRRGRARASTACCSSPNMTPEATAPSSRASARRASGSTATRPACGSPVRDHRPRPRRRRDARSSPTGGRSPTCRRPATARRWSRSTAGTRRRCAKLRDHELFRDLPTMIADNRFHRAELLGPAELVPDEWMERVVRPRLGRRVRRRRCSASATRAPTRSSPTAARRTRTRRWPTPGGSEAEPLAVQR